MTRQQATRYIVKAWHSWADVGAGRTAIDAGFDDLGEALAVARASDCPLVDLAERGVGIIAERSNLRHPQMAKDVAWQPRDTLGTL